METKKKFLTTGLATIAAAMAAASGCSTPQAARYGMISNPFTDYYGATDNKENIVLRTKQGDRSVEIELPGDTASMTDFSIPLSPHFEQSRGGRSLASVGSGGSGTYDPTLDQTFKETKPSITDREITSQLSNVTPGSEGDQREVELTLGLVPADDVAPAGDRSYLAAMDHIKQLYKYARFEAALLEIDEMLKAYPTDPKLYQMRGTLLERVGRTDLALKSWHQALRLEPGNDSLRRFIDRKEQKKRSLASP